MAAPTWRWYTGSGRAGGSEGGVVSWLISSPMSSQGKVRDGTKQVLGTKTLERGALPTKLSLYEVQPLPFSKHPYKGTITTNPCEENTKIWLLEILRNFTTHKYARKCTNEVGIPRSSNDNSAITCEGFAQYRRPTRPPISIDLHSILYRSQFIEEVLECGSLSPDITTTDRASWNIKSNFHCQPSNHQKH